MRHKFKLRRLLSILISVILVLTLFPASAFAADDPLTLVSAEVTSSGHVELTFSKEMAAPASGAAGFVVTGYGGQNKNVTAAQLVSGSPEKILLTLGITINGGESPRLSYTQGTVAAADGELLENVVSFGITNTLPHPTLEDTTLTEGTAGTPYTCTFTATGGAAPYYFYHETGSLPMGLTLNQNTGVLSGIPSNQGNFNFDIRVLDSNLAFDRKAFTLTINPASTTELATPSGLAWDTGTPGAVTAVWSEIPNAHQYRVSLYKNGASSPLTQESVTSNSRDYTSLLRGYGPGAYTFTVRALANPISSYTDSNVSEPSSQYTYTPVCVITPTNQYYATLEGALGAVVSGEAITLLQSIPSASGISVSGKTIELNLNGKTLSLSASGQNGIEVQSGGDLTISGGGQLDVNVTGAASHGLYVSGTLTIASPCTVSSAIGIGVYANSGNIILQNASVTGHGIGAQANYGSVKITGDVAAAGGLNSHGVSAYSGGQVEITGSVSAGSIGVFVDGAGSQIIVKGDVTVHEAGSLGVYAFDSGKAKIDGVITTAAKYIQVGTTIKTAADKTLPTTETGYHTYTDGISNVWVKDTSAPVTPPARIAAGSGHSLFLKEDGTVWAWGSNVYGQLGRGTFTDYPYDVPAQVTGLSNVKSVAAGHVYSLALKNDGTVWAWGTNGNGQLGLPQASTPRSHTAIQVAGLSGIQAVSAGYRFCLALDANGDVWAWGNNEKGQLGQPAVETIHTPAKISGLSNVVAVSAGYMHSLALDASGNVWAWGSNYFGELGNGTVDQTGTHPTPSQVTIPPGLTVSAIYAAFQNSMLTTDTGSVYGWGYNSKGSLGDGTITHRSVPTLTLYSGITALGGTGAFYTALKSDGTVWASGENDFSSEIINYGATPVSINGLTEITAVAQGNGGNHALALELNGDVWAWGSNTSEQCGQNTDYYGQPKKIDPPVKVLFPGGATYTIAPITNQTMTPLTAGYASGTQQTKTITITRTGTGNLTNLAVALSGPGAGSFDLTQPIVTVLNTSTPSTTFSVKAKNGLAAGTYTATGTVSADNMANATFTVTQVVNAPVSNPPGGPTGSSNNTPPPSYKADVSGSGSVNTLPVSVNAGSNSAGVIAVPQQGSSLTGGNPVVITMPSIPGVASFSLEIPVNYLSIPDGQGVLTIETDAGSISIPSDMLGNVEGEKAKIIIGKGDTSHLSDDVKTAIGSRPLIHLTLTLDGKQAEWSNPAAPVTVSIPYAPTAAELQDPEHIVIWYIDGSGNAVSVPSGRYDPETGIVTFTTTHFSDYAVVYVHKTFADLNGVKWAKKAIEAMASKGITNGTGKEIFSPSAGITRADYMVMLVKSLGLTASFEQNFADVPSGVYYYEALGIARELGIATGSGNNRFLPKDKISRQDMMALTARALEKAGKLEPASDTGILDQFSDKTSISGYAAESLAALIKSGLITGSGNKLYPRGDTTRAEAAVFLYRIYNQ